MQPCLIYFEQQLPELFSRIQLHETGSPTPSLSGVGAVLFWLGDPLRELYPECFEEAIRIARNAEQEGIPVFQHPESLNDAGKYRVSRTWKEIGLPTPDLIHFRDREELDSCGYNIDFPVVLRPDNLYSQIGIHWVKDRAELNEIMDKWDYYPGTLAEFVDTRMPYKVNNDDSIWAHYFHKKRLFVFGDIIRTTHVFFSRSPIVGMKGSVFWHHHLDLRSKTKRESGKQKECKACLQADIEYWEMREDKPELFRKAVKALGFDFAAIDYSSFPDGSIMLWEANPYFYLEPWQQAVLPRLRRTKTRIPGFYDSIGDFCYSLLDGSYQRND